MSQSGAREFHQPAAVATSWQYAINDEAAGDTVRFRAELTNAGGQAREDSLPKGLYLMRDGRVLVDYGARRVPISLAQYRANGYMPPYRKLPAEAPSEATKAFAKDEAPKVALAQKPIRRRA